jgi:hypothetical protein
MGDDETRSGMDGPAAGLSRPLIGLLNRHAAAAAAVRRAETAYRAAYLTPPPAAQGRTARAAAARVGEAFEVLTESVVELQSTHSAVLAHALNEGLSPDQVRELDEEFARTDRELAAYLDARTYDQVRVTAADSG